MKPTENYEQLLQRFTKRTEQLRAEQAKLDDAYEKWNKLDEQLHYLRGCKETVEYLAFGRMPNDGNHDGIRDHKPPSSVVTSSALEY